MLVHLVMQPLTIDDLARLSCTCRLMRAAALHPSAGRFLRSPLLKRLPSVGLQLPRRDDPRARLRIGSPLGRAHLSVTLTLVDDSDEPPSLPPHELVPALLSLAAGWAHVRELDLACAHQWPPQHAIELVSSPALRRVASVTDVGGVWLTEPVLSALCRLALLSSLSLSRRVDDAHPALRLHPSALALAPTLRSIDYGRCDLPAFCLAGLICAPQLSRLVLSTDRWFSDADQPVAGLLCWLQRCCRPLLANLRSLHLSFVHLANQSAGDLRRFLRAMTKLRYLAHDTYEPDRMLRALVAVGPAAMAELRVVRFWQGDETSMVSPLVVRRFLRHFPCARYCLTVAGEDGPQWAHDRFAAWDRVCLKSDHADPTSDGVCGPCTAREPERWADVIGLPLPDEPSESAEEQAQSRALEAEDAAEEPAPLRADDALRLVEAEYATALAAAAPWKVAEPDD